MAAKLAAVTMVYNEPEFLPLWLRHYAREVGAENCHVIDHGSDDGSTMGSSMGGLGTVNIVRIPRSPQDDPRRTRFLNHFCAGLLAWYDRVLYADVDEILLADPRFHDSLAAYCDQTPPQVVTAIGFNLHHLPDAEPPIDLARPITGQRRWARFTASMCKPALIGRAVEWTPGFHWATDAPVVPDTLFLFHLRWVDLGLGLRRLARTRAMPWEDAGAAWWQRCSDETGRELFAGPALLPRREDVSFDRSLPPLAEAIARTIGNETGRAENAEGFALNFSVDELWALPPRFIGRF